MPEFEEEEKWVCHGCIGDEYLKEELAKGEEIRECSYCGQTQPGISLEDLAERIDEIVDRYFRRTESEAEWGWRETATYSVEEMLGEIAELEEEIGEDVRSYLEAKHTGRRDYKDGIQNPFDEEACYERMPPNHWPYTESWDLLKRSLRSNVRFFHKNAKDVLNGFFSGLEDLQTYDGENAVRSFGPGGDVQSVYRARIAETKKEIREFLTSPCLELGPPPPDKTPSGRMNAAGIPAFYGGLSEDVCVAEVRPPVGSNVVVARFEIIRPIRLLDFGRLKKIVVKGSYFEPDFEYRLGRNVFLSRLVNEIKQPVTPAREEREYLATQVVAEYLALVIDPQLDGVIFPSSQIDGDGENVVLFPRASRVEPDSTPVGTTFRFGLGTHSDFDFEGIVTVWEIPPTPTEEGPREEPASGPSPISSDFFESPENDEDREFFGPPRETTLRMDLNGIQVWEITGVTYARDERRVKRRRENEEEEDPGDMLL